MTLWLSAPVYGSGRAAGNVDVSMILEILSLWYELGIEVNMFYRFLGRQHQETNQTYIPIKASHRGRLTQQI